MKELERYMERCSSAQSQLLKELECETNLRAVKPQMISGHLQGKFLELLTRMLSPKRVLEIGTYTGYSALSMAYGMDGGVIDTIEADDELHDFTQQFVDRADMHDRIRLHTGSALKVAAKLEGNYDLIFVDGDKREYPDYLNMIMGDGEYAARGALVHCGSWIVADNVLWYGKVVDPAAHDLHTQRIDMFNKMVADDSRLENVLLPVRDGLNIIRVKTP